MRFCFAQSLSAIKPNPKKMNTEQSVTIDLSYLHSVTGGDREFEKMLLQGAVDDIQDKIDSLQKAWDAEDAVNIRSNAHSLKSLTAIAGLPQIEKWSKVIDQVFADGCFHAQTLEPFTGILSGWILAKPKLQEVIAGY